MKIFIWSICLVVFESCNPKLDFNYGTQVSPNVKESKQNKVFLSQYKIENVKSYDNRYSFPIKEVWAERSWNMTIDSAGNEVRQINSSYPPVMVFLLYKNDSLNEKNYLNKWILMNSDSSSGGITGKSIYLTLNKSNLPDNLQLTIYKLTDQYDIKHNLERIAYFLLKRK